MLVSSCSQKVFKGKFSKLIDVLAGPEEYPTLLHFAARWGLERMSLLLLECPGGNLACEIRNISGKTPSELADQHGHHKLSLSIKNFSVRFGFEEIYVNFPINHFQYLQKMNEFNTIYHYFKEFSESSSSGKTVVEIKATTNTKEEPKEPNQEVLEEQAEGYLEMNGSGGENDTNNNEILKGNAIQNLNYLNLSNENSASDSVDVVDAVEMKELKKRDVVEHFNELTIKEDSKDMDPSEEITNELKITEPKYYDSQELNKTDDTFSKECSNLLENCSTNEIEIVSLCPSVAQSPEREIVEETPASFTNPQFGDYCIPSNNQPIGNLGDYCTPPNNKSIFEHDYMNQSASQPRNERETSHLRLYFKKKGKEIVDDEDGLGYSKIMDLPSPTKSSRSNHSTLKRHGSDISKKSVDDDLVEIINDFKNNILSIQEVEKLFSAWQNRNDVKKSFKDKQEQLQKMREEYERIQQKMNDSLKRPSPFERMKRLFTRKHGKADTLKAEAIEHMEETLKLSQTDQRPISTLSLHSNSSSSSGRMSTSSQVSVGDSGTHSDLEERRVMNGYNATAYRIGVPGSLMDNYLIPPTPRPISTPLSTPSEDHHSPHFPISRGCTPEHYIMFPSNIPVSSMSPMPLNDISLPSISDYHNFSVLNTIDENKESENNQLGIQLQPIKIQKKEIIYSESPNRFDNACSSFKPKTNLNQSDCQKEQEGDFSVSSNKCNDSKVLEEHDYLNVSAD